jgi:hypothetical protein
MTQTTEGFSAVNAMVEYSINGADWVDISGFANSIKPGALTRQTGVRFTHEGDTGIITSGKRGSLDIDLSIIYTETPSPDPFEAFRAEFEEVGGGAVWLRWAPKGNTPGNYLFTSDAGILKKLDPPATDTEDPKPVAVSLTIETAKITRSVIV